MERCRVEAAPLGRNNGATVAFAAIQRTLVARVVQGTGVSCSHLLRQRLSDAKLRGQGPVGRASRRALPRWHASGSGTRSVQSERSLIAVSGGGAAGSRIGCCSCINDCQGAHRCLDDVWLVGARTARSQHAQLAQHQVPGWLQFLHVHVRVYFYTTSTCTVYEYAYN